MIRELQRVVAQWMLDEYSFFSELLELAIFVHRWRSRINVGCFDGELSLDAQLKFNMLSPIHLISEDEMLVITFELWRHNGLTVSYLDMNDPENDSMFDGHEVFELLGEEDFIHFERCDMSDVPRAHKIIRKRLKEFAE